MLKRLRDLFSSRPSTLNSVASRVDDAPGWAGLSGGLYGANQPHDYDSGKIQEIYQDALEAWRKNPIAWRTIAITTDYIVGDKFTVNSPVKTLDRFVKFFWNHPKNLMPLRLESLSDELSRAGDLFILLFRNPQDGMSYIRTVTKDRIERIETAANDWETELVYYERQDIGDPKPWYSPTHPEAGYQDAIMLHYAINRPLGALMGESDLTTQLPWLLRYSRMLEDRVRLHWAMRAFLWLVTVPSNRVAEKKEQYRNPPDGGSIIVKDETETWEAQAPNLRGSDAKYDMQAVRAMIDAGSGYPPHWRGDAGDISLATAQAMQGPTERHLLRRQRHFIYMIQDILYHAYERAVEIGMARPLPKAQEVSGRRSSGGLYDHLFTIHLPDISRFDNRELASAARDITQAYSTLAAQLPALTPSLAKEAIRAAFKFAGEPISQELIDDILAEIEERKGE